MTKRLTLGTCEFQFVDFIRPKLGPLGKPIEYSYEIERSSINSHGTGPFCHFHVSSAKGEEGVYAISVDGSVVYIGQTKDLSFRFGPNGYGSIYAKNCEVGGQSTNCKVNGRILAQAKAGRVVELWFFKTPFRQRIEAELIQAVSPDWNHAKAPTQTLDPSGRSCSPTAIDFEDRLNDALGKAQRNGRGFVDILSKDLHKSVGGYPGPSHRMPICCDVMRRAMRAGDQVLESPPKGRGASLLIRYMLPRA